MINKEEFKKIFEKAIISIGDNPNREGLLDSPRRIIESYSEILDGYNKDPKKIFKVFKSDYKGLVAFNNIPFYSLCEHHFLPIIGNVSIGIYPSKINNQVIGFNKIPKLVNVFAHRLQIQENLTKQITDCIDELLSPDGVIVITKARHLCSEMRSVKLPPHTVNCMDFRGCFNEMILRQEFIEQQNINI